MILLIIILLPFISGLFLLFFRNTSIIRSLAAGSAGSSFLLTLFLIVTASSPDYSVSEITFYGVKLSIGYDGISLIMLLITGFDRKQENLPVLNFLILSAQSALIGVFIAQSAFLFYIFWELALIPVYFILLLWGGDGRRSITLKFFIYTITGSLFLLFGIIYLYQLTPGVHSTDFSAFNQLKIPENTQIWLFWILFIAFAIKMPLFPFHTWQPATYSMASTQGVMILAGVMTKMGIYGALRFLFPVVPLGVHYWQDIIITLSLTGMIYASVIAFRQSNLKKLIAFSSMAHISLMIAALFAFNFYSLRGVLIQVISHSITITALFYIAKLLKDKAATLDLTQMGGIKYYAPNLAIILLIVVLSSVSLPLTAGFVGEFLMITGLFYHSFWFALCGGTTIILSAIYMLYAYQRIMLGDKKPVFEKIGDIRALGYCVLIPLITVILVLGIYPQPIFNLTEASLNLLRDLWIPFTNTSTSLIY
jgi:NADH-quinone oxidoreductase subunit M